MNSYLESIRSIVGHQKIPLVFTSAIILNSDHEILWQKRSDFKIWGLPGGMLEIGETLEECVIRETLEETGLKIYPARMLGIYSSPTFDIRYPNGDEAQQITFCFLCTLDGGKEVVDGIETLEMNWFPKNVLPKTTTWYTEMWKTLQRGSDKIEFQAGKPGSPEQIDYFPTKVLDGGAAIVPRVGGTIYLSPSPVSISPIPIALGERADQTFTRIAKKEYGISVRDLEANPIITTMWDPTVRHYYVTIFFKGFKN